MAAWIRVDSLQQLQGLLSDGASHQVRFVGVEAVRSAPEMLRLAEGIKKITPVAEGALAIYLYMTRDSSSDEEEEAVDDAADDEDSYWFVEGLPQVRRVALLSNIATELADVVVPALTASPDDLLLLKRLRELGRDVRSAGLLEQGDARENALILGTAPRRLRIGPIAILPSPMVIVSLELPMSETAWRTSLPRSTPFWTAV